MNVISLTPIRILGEGLEVCLSRHPETCLLATVPDLLALRPRKVPLRRVAARFAPARARCARHARMACAPRETA